MSNIDAVPAPVHSWTIEMERAAALLWRKENPDKNVFAITSEEQARYRVRILRGERP